MIDLEMETIFLVLLYNNDILKMVQQIWSFDFLS